MAYERVGGGVSAARRKTKRPGQKTYRPPSIAKPKPAPKPHVSAPVTTQPQRTPAAANIGYTPPALTGGAGGYDINSDPAVAAAQGLAAKMRATAQASALAKRVQAALEYGDPTGVEGLTSEQQQTARDNPFSVLKNLEHTYDVGKRDLEEELNKGNLFYSGYRGQQLGEAARAYQNQRYGAGSAFKGLMTDIGDQLANALMNADTYEAQAALGSSGGGYDYGDSGGSGGENPNLIYPNASGYYDIGHALGAKPGPGPYITGTPTKPKTTTQTGGYFGTPRQTRRTLSARLAAGRM